MAQIKFGVVGAIRGMTFIELLGTFGDMACLHAVCENNSENLAKAQDKIPENVKVYSDYDEFLNSGIDAVVLTNFFHEHSSFAIKALEKNIHVISDTTAAPTLGDCVKLVRAAEKSKAKYMLGTNGIFKKCIQFMKKQLEDGKLGKQYFAEAEYLHCSEKPRAWGNDDTHWRRIMPGTYYNMHTLGTLMYATNTMPKKVTARVIYDDNQVKKYNYLHDHVGAISLCEMDNGATFSVTGCCRFGPTSKWFRLIGENGTLETQRYDETTVMFASYDKHFFPDEEMPEIEVYKPKYEELNMDPKEEFESYTEEQMRLGHGGIDFWLLLNFIKYINGEYEPFFDVYRSTALSATAILGWRSILNNCLEYEIPDFTKEEDRKKYENDFFSPFEEEGSEYFVSPMSR